MKRSTLTMSQLIGIVKENRSLAENDPNNIKVLIWKRKIRIPRCYLVDWDKFINNILDLNE